jgi:hypothetical protein
MGNNWRRFFCFCQKNNNDNLRWRTVGVALSIQLNIGYIDCIACSLELANNRDRYYDRVQQHNANAYMHLHGHCASPNLSPIDNAMEETFFLPRREVMQKSTPSLLKGKWRGRCRRRVAEGGRGVLAGGEHNGGV